MIYNYGRIQNKFVQNCDILSQLSHIHKDFPKIECFVTILK